MPRCKVSRDAFASYLRAGRPGQLLCDLWETVLVFTGVYVALGAEIAAGVPAEFPRVAGHSEAGELVLRRTGRIAFLENHRRAAHRHALAAGVWEQEMRSWHAEGRCIRDRPSVHNRSGVLDRPLNPFRHFARYGAYTLCPQCRCRNYRRPFAWPVLASLRDPMAYVEAPLARGAHILCRGHSESRVEYPVPDLLAISPIPGSTKRRWKYWPRYPL